VELGFEEVQVTFYKYFLLKKCILDREKNQMFESSSMWISAGVVRSYICLMSYRIFFGMLSEGKQILMKWLLQRLKDEVEQIRNRC
jgi:hypothetical protein